MENVRPVGHGIDLIEILIEILPGRPHRSISEIPKLVDQFCIKRSGKRFDYKGRDKDADLWAALTLLIRGVQRGEKKYRLAIGLNRPHFYSSLEIRVSIDTFSAPALLLDLDNDNNGAPASKV